MRHAGRDGSPCSSASGCGETAPHAHVVKYALEAAETAFEILLLLSSEAFRGRPSLLLIING